MKFHADKDMAALTRAPAMRRRRQQVSRKPCRKSASLICGRAPMELGRSERTTMRPLWSYGVDGANTPDRKPR